MYKILLADDEGIVLDSLRFIIDKHFGESCEVRTAKSGRMAVEVAQEFSPDIVLLDIQMPGLNGIEVLKEIRTFRKQAVFVVISAYDRFDYARKALSLGALEYILKPFSKEKVVSAIQHAMDAISEERTKKSRELVIREKLESVVPLIENGFMNLMLLQGSSAGELEQYRQLLDLKEENGVVVAIQFGEKEELENPIGSSVRLQGSLMRVRGLVREFFPKAIVSSLMANRVFLFLPVDEYGESEEERERLVEQTRKLIFSLQKKTGLKYRAGIGEACRIEDMRESCRQAQKAVNQGKGRIVHIRDLDHPCKNMGKEDRRNEKARQQAEGFFGWMEKTYGECPRDIREKVLGLLGSMDQEESAGERQQKHNSRMVKEAKDYISKSFDKEISLEEVARRVEVSPYYLSKIFKEEEGKNFVEYVTELRMEKAKQLLRNKDMSIKEVCISVGYGDPNYFSRIFKRAEGCTPTEFREGKTG